jgi:hypothetical protein
VDFLPLGKEEARIWVKWYPDESPIISRQGNNEEQAHTKNKGTNEHD